MYIYRVTHRYYYGERRPHECKDYTLNYFTTAEKARTCVKDCLGKDAKCEDDFGFEIWTSDFHPDTEYIIDMIRVY